MRNSLATTFAIALVSLALTDQVVAKEGSRLPAGPEELALTLTVDEALEEGPIVCTLSLKNLTKDTLRYYAWSSGGGGWCHLDTGWKVRKEVDRCSVTIGNIGPYCCELRPAPLCRE